MRIFYFYLWDIMEGFLGWNVFRDNESFYLVCLKVIVFVWSGYLWNFFEFLEFVEWIKFW